MPLVSRPQSALIACALLALAAGAVHVQPRDADVLIDDERWDVGPEGRVDVQAAAGHHRVEIRRRGSRPFNQDVEVRADEATPVNVSLVPEP